MSNGPDQSGAEINKFAEGPRSDSFKIIHLAHYVERLNRRLQSPLMCEEKDCIKAKLVHLSKRLAKFGASVKQLSAQRDVLLLAQTAVLLLALCGADTQ